MFLLSPVYAPLQARSPRSTMANKKYPSHGHKTPFYAKICRINAGLQVSPVHEKGHNFAKKSITFPVAVVKMVVKRTVLTTALFVG